jgi:hypothetical protein
MRRALAWAALAACPGACHDADPGARGAPAASDDASATEVRPAGAAALLPARCHPNDGPISIEGEALAGGSPRDPDDLGIGDGVAHGDGYAVGLVHRTSAGRVAAVAVLGANAAGVRVVDLAPTPGDAPPPQLAVCRDRLVAAAFRLPAVPGGGGSAPVANRDLGLYVVDPDDPAGVAASIPQRRDDSLAFDLACSAGAAGSPGAGLVVWDETAAPPGAAPRGVIRAAAFVAGPAGIRAGPVVDVSSPGSDAEMPRVVPGAHGFVVLWVARRPESSRTPDGPPGRFEADSSGAIEATGEARAYGWLEMIAVDGAGKPAGPLRRLTSPSGHVSAYDVQARTPAQGGISLLVVARDDQEAVDGSGGTLLRVRMRDDTVEPPAELPTDGLGRGAPSFVDSPATWLAWVGPREQPRLLPLGPSGEALGGASAEEELDDARPLVSLALSLGLSPGASFGASFGAGATSAADAGAASAAARSLAESRMLVAELRDGPNGARLRVFGCRR